MQYVERGIILLDDQFAKRICKSMNEQNDYYTSAFKFQLISKLEHKVKKEKFSSIFQDYSILRSNY